MAEYIESEFNPCDVCDYKRCNNCVLHELAMKAVGHPAADVAPVVHGQWVLDNYTNRLRCSECETYKPYNVVEDIIDYWDCDYCPICGAIMDGDSNGRT